MLVYISQEHIQVLENDHLQGLLSPHLDANKEGSFLKLKITFQGSVFRTREQTSCYNVDIIDCGSGQGQISWKLIPYKIYQFFLHVEMEKNNIVLVDFDNSV